MIEKSPSKVVMLIPCFNEGARLNLKFWQQIADEINCEWMFIDDGSTDDTLKKIESITGIRVLSLDKNAGKAEAIRKGIRYVLDHPEFIDYNIGYIDSDDAFLIEDIKKVLEKFNSFEDGFDAIWVSRVALAGRKISRNTKRHLISRIIVTLLGFVYKEMPYDPQAGFKIFKARNFSNVIIDKKFKTRWFIDLEILTRMESLKKRKLNIWEEPVSSWRDIPGSKINGLETLRVLFELWRVFRILLENKKNKWT
jgi:dolichyl-phosphate beta-glucosyltransferase